MGLIPGGGYSQKFRIGVCPRDVETLTLFNDEEMENSYPFQGFVTEI